MASTVDRTRAAAPETLRESAERFLDTLDAPNTRRAYSIAVTKVVDELDQRAAGPEFAVSRPLALVSEAEIGAALHTLWGTAAINTWNARRAAIGKWLTWCRAQGWAAPGVPASARRFTPPETGTRVRSHTEIDHLIDRHDIHLREQTLWRMLYETCARADELLQLNIEDLDLAGRRAPVSPTGAVVSWGIGTALLLPRLIQERTHGPLFITHRRPRPGKRMSPRDMCPDTGYARLSYDQARAVLDTATAVDGPGSGWDLRDFRHSGLSRP
ncbi:site-specific integrase [Nocardia sp. NPDC127579]|uniref:site-specific integrase n=1 Tax=Nocardia sp. NPDC127579 TaxID=3345402 RepID=UPI003645A4AB